MLKKISKIPAGTFLVPLILSILINTFWPTLFEIGGLTEGLLSGSGTPFIAGMLTFATGTRIDIRKIKDLIKHQGSLLLIKIILASILSLGYLYFFGNEGIFGISGIAFLAVMFSINPVVQISLLESYGYKDDTVVMGLSSTITLPIFPVLIYSFYASSGGGGGINLMPIVSSLFPLILGMTLGNLDRDFEKLFSPALTVLLPLIGWNLGQSMNLIEALRSGISGVVLTAMFIIVMSTLYFSDKKLLGYEGVSGLAMMSVAGISTIVPGVIASSFPEAAPFVTSANSQILLASIITSIAMPIVIGRIQAE